MPRPAHASGPFARVELPLELASEASFLTHLGMSRAELNVIQRYAGRMYHTFEIKKKSGKARVINAPDKRLKMLQRKIADLLTPLYRRRNPVHGFVLDRSVKTNAQSHIGGKFLVNLDLKDFFPTISQKRITGVLRSLGIEPDIANAISVICCVNGCLPQGAPSSPILSNMVCFRLDRELLAFAKQARCIYTRYADDLTFSSYQPLNGLFETAPPSPGHFPPDLLTKPLQRFFASNGFTVNPTKLHYSDRHSRRTVTGIRINESLNVDRRFVRNLRAALYSVETLGTADAESKFRDSRGGTAALGKHLQGKVSWLGHIKGSSDPIFRKIASRFNNLFPDLVLRIQPTAQEIRERAVWLIEHGDGAGAQGTAFFLKGTGLVTAAHCMSSSGIVEIYHPTKPSNKFSASVKHLCNHRDLAVLEHNIPDNEFYELVPAATTVSTGDLTTAIGYPGFGPGDKLNIRPGQVTSLPTKSMVKMIEVQQMLSQGMSGGPLLNTHDQVVGVVHKGGPDYGRQLAIAITALTSWLS